MNPAPVRCWNTPGRLKKLHTKTETDGSGTPRLRNKCLFSVYSVYFVVDKWFVSSPFVSFHFLGVLHPLGHFSVRSPFVYFVVPRPGFPRLVSAVLA
jgi:hypothetical protein